MNKNVFKEKLEEMEAGVKAEMYETDASSNDPFYDGVLSALFEIKRLLDKEDDAVKGVHGYKVFNSDWTCRSKQYTCPGKFEEEGKLEVCGHGMHFCQTAADCFTYYSFNSENKVAEVIAYGEVKTDGDKSCTDKLEIVREIPWDEVLRIVNLGKNCTGIYNTGNHNAGHYNTGIYNTGSHNTGDCNIGDWNTGYRNTGDFNTGNCNTGDRNAGDYNTGHYNTGDFNTGNRNTGDFNTGNCNTGDWNTGNRNTGDYNTGHYNTGDWNKSSFNIGCFNTVEQKIMLFNKPSDITHFDWHESDARCLLIQAPMDVVEWIYPEDMTDKEKVEHPAYKTTNGYLKVLDKSEHRQLWWDNLSDTEKETIKSIPNFEPDIFFECTGIRVE